MSSSQKHPKVLWSPHAPYYALVGGNDLRLYEYIEPKIANKKPRLAMVGINTDVPLLKCFDWSRDPATADILAVGQSTGKTSLLKWHPARRFPGGVVASGGLEATFQTHIEDSITPEASLDGSATSILTLNVRHSRACNAVAFSYAAPHLLATGLDKVRNDYSLLVWDLHSLPAGYSQEAVTSNTFHPNTLSPLSSPSQPYLTGKPSSDDVFSVRSPPLPRVNSLSNSVDQPPSRQFFSSEAVLSLAWIPASSSELLAGLGLKRIRLLDLRDASSSMSSSIFSTKAVYGIQVDPFHPQRFISHSEDGLVKLWDRRKSSQPILTFNADSHSSNLLVQFSPSHPNKVAVLNREDTRVRIWDLAESVDDTNVNKTALAMSQSLLLSGPKEDDYIPHPIIWKTRQTMDAAQSLASFSWIPPSLPSRNQQELLILAKDGTSDILCLREPLSIAWNPLGHVVTAEPSGLCFYGPSCSGESSTDSSELVNQLIAPSKRATPSTAYAETASVSQNSHLVGPRSSLSAKSKKPLNIVARATAPHEISNSDSDVDMSVTMASRAQLGYAMDPVVNFNICANAPNLQEIWDWVSKVQFLHGSGYSKIDGIDGAFQSISTILNNTGRNPFVSRKGSQGSSTIPRHSTYAGVAAIQATDPTNFENGITSTTMRKNPSYPAERQRSSNSVPSARPIGKHRCRMLALETLHNFSTPLFNLTAAIENSEGVVQLDGAEKIIQNLERNGDIDQAAYFSLILISLKRAYEVLQRSNVERYQLMATALSARVLHNSSCQEEWQSQCHRMAIALTEPYIQAIFLYAWKESWFDMLHVTKLPLRDRLLAAVRFLEREELIGYLNQLASELVKNGNLSGLIIVGLASPQSVELLSNYVDQTSDIQTAALLFSFGCPFFRLSDSRGQTWVENYRLLLDQWKMWHIRCSWDIARKSHAQKITTSLSAASGVDFDRQERILPHVAIRCNFCNANIGPSLPMSTQNSSPSLFLAKSKRSNTAPGSNGLSASTQPPIPGNSYLSQKTTCCPNCKKPLPRCALCLLHLGTPADPSCPSTSGLFPSMHISTTVPDSLGVVNSNTPGDPRSPNSPHTAKPSPSGPRAGQEATPSGMIPPLNGRDQLAQSFNFWFAWCQTCRHGGHAAHMSQWFARHSQCPVADCQCFCSLC